ncbi:hypothetical protein [Hoylesella shahii]
MPLALHPQATKTITKTILRRKECNKTPFQEFIKWHLGCNTVQARKHLCTPKSAITIRTNKINVVTEAIKGADNKCISHKKTMAQTAQ